MPHVEPLREGDPAAVGPYRLMGRLGAGGQGIVYLAQGRNGVPVAVKVLRDGLADDRFAKEIAAARRVEPFCIAQVLDASLGGRPYIVTEYVEGPSLQQAGRHGGAELQRLAVATATALAAIHQAGVVHRDFKPANVLLGPGGPRVIDFGIARAADAGLTATSSIVGTPAYMAPEQLAGAAVGPAADVFAWASVIVFAANGTPPFGDDSLPAVINRILHNEPMLGDLPQPLRSIVLGCLAKDPARRPPMQEVLLQLLGGQAPARPGPTTVPTKVRGGTRTAVIAGFSGVSALALAGAIVWLTPTVAAPHSGNPSVANTSTGVAISQHSPTDGSTPRHRPRRTRTPRSTPSTSPSTSHTATPTKSSTPTASPKSSSSGGGSLRIVWVHVQGARKANTQDCEIGESLTSGLVEGTKLHTLFRYSWIIDGRVKESSEAYIADSYTQNLTGPNIKTTGVHTVTLRLTSPRTISKQVTVKICPVGTE
ncbi:serine/threonine-protein kinase [Nonomuraea sediminis]|uniref:serine/threonine-protein kinase n=1 Tax=Nonomuraea sediminis TaxID=2835864 RepID=UPI001BDBF04E|nr:serine/threonine-protein kinase [Nonomuraea sediminis]